ncbi:hypothetical protein F4821DRAFT_274711 [Hypoxylon rubiginosum]|uniref:Uncharacterized protein n=1 Tax=Hypoxylon rubiginosum TaxID=110542 RepID=A0ACC0DCN8_9PEZI|nr:hypothetical protein F4821DRAFT_274711 [Hypoxylon rubiginosum]
MLRTAGLRVSANEASTSKSRPEGLLFVRLAPVATNSAAGSYRSHPAWTFTSNPDSSCLKVGFVNTRFAIDVKPTTSRDSLAAFLLLELLPNRRVDDERREQQVICRGKKPPSTRGSHCLRGRVSKHPLALAGSPTPVG